MFRSFFPNPRSSFRRRRLAAVPRRVWFTVGERPRAISIDRFFVPPFCAATRCDRPSICTPLRDRTVAAASELSAAADASAAARHRGSSRPRRQLHSARRHRFLSGAKVWQYEYVFLGAVLFCVFWYFFSATSGTGGRVVGSVTIILLSVYFNVQISAWVNDWYGAFYDLIQLALSEPEHGHRRAVLLGADHRRCASCCRLTSSCWCFIAFFNVALRVPLAQGDELLLHGLLAADPHHRRRGAARPGRHA